MKKNNSKRSNNDILTEVRRRNKNKNRIITEIVLSENQAIMMYAMVQLLSTLPKNAWKGLRKFKIALSNLLMIRYELTSTDMQNLRQETESALEYLQKNPSVLNLLTSVGSNEKI